MSYNEQTDEQAIVSSHSFPVRRVQDRHAVVLTEEVAAALARLHNGQLHYRGGHFYQLYMSGYYFTTGQIYFTTEDSSDLLSEHFSQESWKERLT